MLNKEELKYLDNGIDNLDLLIKDLKEKPENWEKKSITKELDYILSNFIHVKLLQSKYRKNH